MKSTTELWKDLSVFLSPCSQYIELSDIPSESFAFFNDMPNVSINNGKFIITPITTINNISQCGLLHEVCHILALKPSKQLKETLSSSQSSNVDFDLLNRYCTARKNRHGEMDVEKLVVFLEQNLFLDLNGGDIEEYIEIMLENGYGSANIETYLKDKLQSEKTYEKMKKRWKLK